MTEEKVRQISALFRLLRTRQWMFAVRLVLRALPIWAGTSVIAAWLYPFRTIVVLAVTYVVTANVVFLLAADPIVDVVLIAIAIEALVLLAAGIASARREITADPPFPTLVDVDEAPELHAMLDRAIDRVGGPHITGICLTGEFAIDLHDVAVQRWLLRRRATFLAIGAPVLLALTREQLEAQVAATLAMRTVPAAALDRLAAGTVDLRERLRERAIARGSVLLRLVDSFAGRARGALGTYRFALRLAMTYDGDAAAARAYGSRTVAEGLTAVATLVAFYSRSWLPALWLSVKDHPEPSDRYFRAIGEELRAIDREEAKIWVSELAVIDGATLEGTPALGDRLRALGEPAVPPPPFERAAAEELIPGPYLEGWLATIDRERRDATRRTWRTQHHLEHDRRFILERLRADRDAGVELEERDWLRIARFAEVVDGEEDALAEFRAALERFPASHVAAFSVGRILLERGDESGVEMIDRAIDADAASYLQAGAGTVEAFLSAHPESRAAGAMIERRASQREHHATYGPTWETITLERERVMLDERFVAHEAGPHDLELLERKLRAIPEIDQAYLARRIVSHFTHIPSHLLGVVLRADAELDHEGRTALFERLVDEVSWLGETFVIPFDEGVNEELWRSVERVEGSLVYVAPEIDVDAREEAGDEGGDRAAAESEDAPDDIPTDAQDAGAATARARRRPWRPGALAGSLYVGFSWIFIGTVESVVGPAVLGLIAIVALVLLGMPLSRALMVMAITPWIVVPVISVTEGYVDFHSGTAMLIQPQPELVRSASHWNDLQPIDADTRIRWRVFRRRPVAVDRLHASSYNATVRALVERYGPQAGSYDGALPDADRARLWLLDSARPVTLVAIDDDTVRVRGERLYIPRAYVDYYRVEGFTGKGRTIVGGVIDGRLALYGSMRAGSIVAAVGLDVRNGERVVSYMYEPW